MSRFPGFLVAGTHSGVGKTTVSFALMTLLAQKGLAVQPFKIGPDFIDGGYHRLATGRDSVNLDLWMMGWEGIRESFARYAGTADISVLEGMGALFDGKNGTPSGSSAEVAKRLGIPVLLVMDIWGMTVTTGALLEGLLAFDRKVSLAGVILNRAGSRGHFEMVLKFLKPSLRKKVLGYLPRSRELEIPERHLGLKTLEENKNARGMKEVVVKTASQTIDLGKLTHLFKVRKGRGGVKSGLPKNRPRIRLGLAKDEAFCFYYTENLRMLEEAGAELIPFSPLRDRKLPDGLAGLYLGGGYPESFPRKLSSNRSLRGEILRKVREGMPVYAECGGLMYLSRSLAGFHGKAFPMVSAFPLKIKMDPKFLAIKYAEVRTGRETLLGPRGTVARGHEFHQSRIVGGGFRGSRPYQVTTSAGQNFREGCSRFNALGSYIHLHFKSNPSVPAAFLRKCRVYESKVRS